MKAYHIACNSNKLGKIVEVRGTKIIHHDYCAHCERAIEDYEIRRSAITLGRLAPILRAAKIIR